MDNPLLLMRYLLLAVLLAPLAGALAVLVAGRGGRDPARRAATWSALIHTGLTLALVLFAVEHLGSRGDTHAIPRMRAEVTFKPTAVPGDPGNGLEGSETFETTWSILSLGPPRAASSGSPAAADIEFYIGIDGLNIWLVALTSLMTLVAVLVSWHGVAERAAGFYAWLLVLETAIIGAFVSFDVVLFYVFFELTLVPTFFLIGSWGTGGGRRDAARKFVLYTLFGSLLTLTGLLGIVMNNPTPVSRLSTGRVVEYHNWIQADGPNGPRTKPDAGPVSFSLPRLVLNVSTWSQAHRVLPYFTADDIAGAEAALAEARTKRAAADTAAGREAVLIAEARLAQLRETHAAQERENARYQSLQTIFFFLMMAGFAVKIPIVPFHTWLPSAYGEAPIGVTMLLSALLAKLGTFGVLRLVVPLCPDAALEYGLPVFGVLGAAGIVYGAFCAFAQRDVKLLTAYSSVSHLGFLVIALFTFTDEGLVGATLHMVNHGLATGAMFALLAFLVDRYRTLDMNQYGGLWAKYPGYAVLMFVAALAGIGVPGFNNFVSEMLMLGGLFDPRHDPALGYGLAAVAAVGILLSSWYVLTMVRRVMFGPLQEPPTATGPVRDVSAREVAAFGLPLLCCLVLGLYPQPVIDTMKADVGVVSQIGQRARQRLDPTRLLESPRAAPVAGPRPDANQQP